MNHTRVILISILETAFMAAASGQPCGTPWTELVAPGPSLRNGSAVAFDSGRNRVVLFGGSPAFNQPPLGDTWEWDGTGSGSWSPRSSSGPAPRWGSALAYDSVRGRSILFGGYNGAPLGDTWEWNGASWLQRSPVSSPSPRYGSVAAFDALRGRIVLFGGRTTSQAVTETWEWDGNTWSLRATYLYAPNGTSQLAYDAARGRIGMYIPYVSAPGPLFEWDGSAWLSRPNSGRDSSGGALLAYDASNARLTIMDTGPTNQPIAPNTWQLEPGVDTWWLRTAQGPLLDSGVMVFDGSHLLALSSPSGSTALRTWRYNSGVSSGPTMTHSITRGGSTQPGQTMTLSVGAAGTGTVSYQWRRQSVNLVNGANISGANTSELTLSNIGIGVSGVYDVILTDACGQTRTPFRFAASDCYANCDGNTALNANDFTCFLDRVAEGCEPGPPEDCIANCDHSTTPPILNVNDLICFVNKFAAGCS